MKKNSLFALFLAASALATGCASPKGAAEMGVEKALANPQPHYAFQPVAATMIENWTTPLNPQEKKEDMRTIIVDMKGRVVSEKTVTLGAYADKVQKDLSRFIVVRADGQKVCPVFYYRMFPDENKAKADKIIAMQHGEEFFRAMTHREIVRQFPALSVTTPSSLAKDNAEGSDFAAIKHQKTAPHDAIYQEFYLDNGYLSPQEKASGDEAIPMGTIYMLGEARTLSDQVNEVARYDFGATNEVGDLGYPLNCIRIKTDGIQILVKRPDGALFPVHGVNEDQIITNLKAKTPAPLEGVTPETMSYDIRPAQYIHDYLKKAAKKGMGYGSGE